MPVYSATPQVFAEHVRRVVDDAPPLTAGQRARLGVLLADSPAPALDVAAAA